jgi:hypothetical protein
MASKGTPYKSNKRRELDGIEARRKAAGVTVDELATKAGMTPRNYYNLMRSGFAFKRTVTALAMAMRTLEGERKREDEIFPFGSGPGQPLVPFAPAPARPSAGATPHLSSPPSELSFSGSGPGQPLGSPAASGKRSRP